MRLAEDDDAVGNCAPVIGAPFRERDSLVNTESTSQIGRRVLFNDEVKIIELFSNPSWEVIQDAIDYRLEFVPVHPGSRLDRICSQERQCITGISAEGSDDSQEFVE